MIHVNYKTVQNKFPIETCYIKSQITHAFMVIVPQYNEYFTGKKYNCYNKALLCCKYGSVMCSIDCVQLNSIYNKLIIFNDRIIKFNLLNLLDEKRVFIFEFMK